MIIHIVFKNVQKTGINNQMQQNLNKDAYKIVKIKEIIYHMKFLII